MVESFFRMKSKGKVECDPCNEVYCVFRSCGSGSIGCEKADLVTEI